MEGSSRSAERVRVLAALQNLASDQDAQLEMSEGDAVPLLVRSLQRGSEAERTHAAGALRELAAVAENQDAIAAAGGVPILVAMLRDGGDALKEEVSGVLLRLSENQDCKELIVASGGVAALLARVRDLDDENDIRVAPPAEPLSVVNPDQSGTEQVDAQQVAPSSAIASPSADMRLDAAGQQVTRAADDTIKGPTVAALIHLSTNVGYDEEACRVVLHGRVIGVLASLLLDGSRGCMVAALGMLLRLSFAAPLKREFVPSGAIPILMKLLSGAGRNLHEKDSIGQILTNLAAEESCAGVIAQEGGVTAFFALAREPTQKLRSLTTLHYLAKSEAAKPFIPAKDRVAILMKMMRSDLACFKADALIALAVLADSAEMRGLMVEAGCVFVLKSLVRHRPASLPMQLVADLLEKIDPVTPAVDEPVSKRAKRGR